MKHFCVFLYMISSFIYGQSVGFSVLTYSKNAISMGGGNSFILSGYKTPQEFLPSMLSNRKNFETTFSKVLWMSDISSDNIFVSFPSRTFGIGFFATLFQVENIEYREEASIDPIDVFQNFYLSYGFSSSYRLSNFVSIGATLKILREKNYTFFASGTAFDFSVHYQKNELILFTSLNHFFQSLDKLDAQKTVLPKIVAGGFSYQFLEWRLGAEYHYIDGLKDEVSLWAGKSWTKWLKLNVGYWLKHSVRLYSLGLSLSYYKTFISYAYLPHKFLDAYHFVQLSLIL